MSKISIIIVNWNSGDKLKFVLESLQKNYHLDLFEVIVFDNNSSDASLSLDCSRYNYKCKIIKSEHNLGFGAACNRAFVETNSPYLLLLNPDMVVEDNVVFNVYEFIQKNPNIDILGVQLYGDHGIQRSCARFPSFKNIILTTMGLAKVFSKYFEGIVHLEWDHKDSREVGHVIGAFYLIKSDLFKSLGGFDEQFFLYYEDLDLSYRAKLLNRKIYYLTDYKIYHEGGGTSKSILDKRLFYSLRSRSQFVKKHYSILKYIIYFVTQYSVEFIFRLFQALSTRKLNNVKNLLRAYTWLLKSKEAGFKSLF